jgi:tetratricopeptide (TPR) repeat protein
MENTETDNMIDLGVQALQEGSIDQARTIFCKVLQREADNPDGHHHLGLIAMNAGNLDEAEQSFRGAIKACDDRSANGIADGFTARGKARSLHSLALVLRRLERRSEAVILLEELLRIDERDGLGGRYILAEEYHRQGKVARAMRMYREQMEDPGARFLLALALIQKKAASAEVGLALLQAFERNRYMAPILLHESHTVSDAHLDNREGAEWGSEAAGSSIDLWQQTASALPTMREWWHQKRVVEWRVMLDKITHMYVNVALLETRAAQRNGREILIPNESIEIRRTFRELREILVSSEYINLLVRTVLGVV